MHVKAFFSLFFFFFGVELLTKINLHLLLSVCVNDNKQQNDLIYICKHKFNSICYRQNKLFIPC